MDSYYLVSEDTTDNPQSLVVIRNGTASVIAGLDIPGLFKQARPDTLKNPSKVFELLTNDTSHPIIGRWIDELGAIVTSHGERGRQLRSKYEHTRGLSEDTKEEIREHKEGGVSYRKIAEIFGVSLRYVQLL